MLPGSLLPTVSKKLCALSGSLTFFYFIFFITIEIIVSFKNLTKSPSVSVTVYRGSSPYANFISANFISANFMTAIFENIP